jgi:hypothetical protein
MDKLLEEDETNSIRENPTQNNSRILATTSTLSVTGKKIPSGFNFSQFLEELKYWLFLVSWLNKILIIRLVNRRKETGEVTPAFFNYVTIS